MARTSKLDAVNEMLATLGEAPVDSLQSSFYQAEQAEHVLDVVTREVLSGDWGFNRDDALELAPDVNGEIVLPDNTLRVTSARESDLYVERGTRLYDKKNHTYTFAKPVKLDFVWDMDFEELPEPARQYISIKAARRFQKQVLGSDTLDSFTKEDEAVALARLNNYDSETTDYNLFDNDEDSYYIVQR